MVAQNWYTSQALQQAEAMAFRSQWSFKMQPTYSGPPARVPAAASGAATATASAASLACFFSSLVATILAMAPSFLSFFCSIALAFAPFLEAYCSQPM